jgi:hypothetical protein
VDVASNEKEKIEQNALKGVKNVAKQLSVLNKLKPEDKKETLPNEASMEQLPDANRPPSDYKPAEDEDNIPERNSALDMAPTISEK